MRLTKLDVRGFTVFEAADFPFTPGVNVLIGENGTGKSHVLKLLYALLAAAGGNPTKEEAARAVRDGLGAIFKPDEGQIGRLVRLGAERADIGLESDEGYGGNIVSDSGDVSVTEHGLPEPGGALFVPSREVLAMFEGFLAAYKDRELSFDETYRDICLALTRNPLKGEAKEAAEALGEPIREMLGGTVELKGKRFYVDLGDGMREAHLIAEGLRKIAALGYLIQNGSIKAGGVLLWDEPEAGLNPRLIAPLAKAILRIAAGGVQVILATHDYLLSHKLSLAAEYDVEPRVAMRFFSLIHERFADPVKLEIGETLAAIQHNPILSEYAAHFDEERELFRGEDEDQGAEGAT